jgi:hypothetical protein
MILNWHNGLKIPHLWNWQKDSKLTESAGYSKVMEFEGEDFKLEFLRMDVDVFPRISFVAALPM